MRASFDGTDTVVNNERPIGTPQNMVELYLIRNLIFTPLTVHAVSIDSNSSLSKKDGPCGILQIM